MQSQVLSSFALRQLAAQLPSRFAYADWQLLYSTAVHGISLNTFYAKSSGAGCCLLALRDSEGNVFGGFSTEWREPNAAETFYGAGESFLYSIEKCRGLPPLPVGDEPPPDEAVHVHRWSGRNSFFMLSSREVRGPPALCPMPPSHAAATAATAPRLPWRSRIPSQATPHVRVPLLVCAWLFSAFGHG